MIKNKNKKTKNYVASVVIKHFKNKRKTHILGYHVGLVLIHFLLRATNLYCNFMNPLFKFISSISVSCVLWEMTEIKTISSFYD